MCSQMCVEAIENIDFGQAQTLVESIKLPPQPQIVMSINKELQRDEPSFRVISDYVVKDAALAAKVLKLVNSSAFSRGKKVDSIQRAMARPGMMNFYTIVLSSCLREAVGGSSELEELFWEHSEVVAGLSSEIAKRSRVASPEQAYLAGLFHDASLPILVRQFPQFEKVVEMVTSTGGNVLKYEEAHLPTHHTVVSYLLCKSWGLPPVIAEAIQFHHSNNLDVFADPDARKLGAVLILADHLSRSHHACLNRDSFPGDPDWPALFEQICDELGLDEDDLEDYWLYGQELAGSV